MAVYENDREHMGEAGYRRVNAFYRIEQMKAVYQEIYQGFAEKHKIPWDRGTVSALLTDKMGNAGWRKKDGWNRCKTYQYL